MIRYIIIFSLAILSFLNPIFSPVEKWLSVDNPVEAELLIVEAWVPDYFAGKVIREFKSNNYKKLLIIDNKQFYNLILNKNRSLCNIEFTQVDTVVISKTLSSAAVAIEWMFMHNFSSANIFSMDLHSRRSLMSYKKLINEGIHVGIISAPSNEYKGKWTILKETGKIIALSFIPKFYINRKFREVGLKPSGQ